MYHGRIPLSSLKGVQFLCANDLYELARLVIRLHEAKNEGTNTITFQTVHGLALAYATLAGVSREQVEAVMNTAGLPLGAAIVDDELRPTDGAP
jgi:hypothetical protein